MRGEGFAFFSEGFDLLAVEFVLVHEGIVELLFLLFGILLVRIVLKELWLFQLHHRVVFQQLRSRCFFVGRLFGFVTSDALISFGVLHQ